ncbi:spermine/spermidine synthase domain-containing protein [Portibacter marinus]|uniref:spermine/spermidine synthase domain-containing protein n=1 Tax=Portibacter marinus TaxID=2898660 RepID=UPI001F1E3030|nr:hypothetical protein [Portibacter marinus]
MHVHMSLPEVSEGVWSIEGFCREGIYYQRLIQNGIIKMLNTPEIVEDFEDFLLKAEGHILINGLGMGMCLCYLLKKRTVKSITIVELDKSLIDFISPFYRDDERCSFIHSDAYEYEPPDGQTYDFVWHDVWTYQSVHNISEIEYLKSKYATLTKWQGAWRESKCRAQRKKEMILSNP